METGDGEEVGKASSYKLLAHCVVYVVTPSEDYCLDQPRSLTVEPVDAGSHRIPNGKPPRTPTPQDPNVSDIQSPSTSMPAPYHDPYSSRRSHHSTIDPQTNFPTAAVVGVQYDGPRHPS